MTCIPNFDSVVRQVVKVIDAPVESPCMLVRLFQPLPTPVSPFLHHFPCSLCMCLSIRLSSCLLHLFVCLHPLWSLSPKAGSHYNAV